MPQAGHLVLETTPQPITLWYTMGNYNLGKQTETLLSYSLLLCGCRQTHCTLAQTVKHKTRAMLDNMYFGTGN